MDTVRISRCGYCSRFTLWVSRRMVFPAPMPVDGPNNDLRADIRDAYREAGQIVDKSPGSAAALLRLCMEKLCGQLGESEADLDRSVENLVERGLPEQLQQALGLVRVVGHDAVHPGLLDPRDDRKTALQLFELINQIAQAMMTESDEPTASYAIVHEENPELTDLHKVVDQAAVIAQLNMGSLGKDMER